MNISAVNYDNQAFRATFHKGDKPSTILPDAVDKDVPDYETVYVSNDGGVPIPYTAAQFRAQQAAKKAVEAMSAEPVPQREVIFHKGDTPSNTLPTKIADDVADDEVVYISNNGGDDYVPYTAGQLRALQN
ncbi:hypothetical protein II906_11835 [bacterium]|nr:hypothetical protein [bacterium]